MGLASNATGRLHTPALKKLQEVIFQQNAALPKWPQMQLLPIQYPCTADWSSDGYKTTTRPRLHSLCTTPKVIITRTINHAGDSEDIQLLEYTIPSPPPTLSHKNPKSRGPEPPQSLLKIFQYCPITRTLLKDLGADVLVCSAYKFFGPHLGLMAFNKERLRSLQPSKVLIQDCIKTL